MSKCSTCVYFDGDDCEMQNYEFNRGGRGCQDYEEDDEEDCGFSGEDLGYGQDEPEY